MAVVVVGAGVIGLSCALALAENGYEVSILARDFPSHPLNARYTSPWAGAHFRPSPSRTHQDAIHAAFTRVTQAHFRKLLTTEPHSSIRFVAGIEYIENPDSYYSNCEGGYSEGMENFRRLASHEIPDLVDLPAVGYSYSAWVLNAPLYIQYLERKLRMHHGCKFICQEARSLKEISESHPGAIIVNCSGMGLQFDGSYDSHSFPIRGQTLLVRVKPDCPYLQQTICHQSKDGLWTFLVPRPLDGGIIVGGTKQVGDLFTGVREQDTEQVTSRATKLFPHLCIDGKLDIQRINVGLRPAREGGFRLEMENIGDTRILHAYGAGGMGYELSWGVAQKAVTLINESSNISAKL